jgi:8-oxo-dGTP diphosphatase
VGAVVFDGDRVLLIRRGKEPLKGRWVVPGGRVEWGETLREATAREVREETGLEVEPGERLAVVEVIDPHYHFVIVDYLCRLAGGTLQAGSDAQDAAFVPLSELDRYEVPPKAQEVIGEGARRRRGDSPTEI